MKLLPDENLPVKLKYRFLDHGIDTYTVAEKKWNAKQNGELLDLLIDEGFTHFVTFDSNISFQQNFLRYPVPVIIIIASFNNYAVIMEVFQELLVCIKNAATGPNLVIHPSKSQSK